jgi:hypothetical protein
MSIPRYISIAIAIAALVCSCWPVAVYSRPRPRWMLEFKAFEAAQAPLAGIALLPRIKKST